MTSVALLATHIHAKRGSAVCLTCCCTFCLQVFTSSPDCSADQPPGLGPYSHAQWTASYTNLLGKAFFPERGHAGQNSPLQPPVGTAWYVANTANLCEGVQLVVFMDVCYFSPPR